MPFVTCEYIWLGGKDTHSDLRSKTRTVSIDLTHDPSRLTYAQLNKTYLEYVPKWNFDGSSTDQAPSNKNTEVILKPCAICLDPFREGSKYPSLLVLCECYTVAYKSTETVEIPHPTNTRYEANKIFERCKNEHPWFGLEQEYILYDLKTDKPIGWPEEGEPKPQGPYYCGNGADKVFGRNIIEEHYQKCLYSRLSISGYNAEVMPGQYEFQIGPVEGISAGDQLILARYILLRICEKSNLTVCYYPKPMTEWNGSGLHHNFSTDKMRKENGYEVIKEAIRKLSEKHKKHLEVYGKDNELRLTGKHETSSREIFSWGVGTRNTSIRVPNETCSEKRGYFEDRRPAANCDPYESTSILCETCCL